MQDLINALLGANPLLSAIATVIGLVLTGYALLNKIGGRIERRRRSVADIQDRPDGMDPLVWATRKLAASTRKLWLDEAIRLGLVVVKESGADRVEVPSASLIRIGWSVDLGRSTVQTGGALDRTLASWQDNPSVDQLGDFFDELPAKALVVLGTPQAGKSAAAVLLTLSLLDKRTTDTDAVPVKFSLAAWDRDLTLEAWLAQRLLEDNPGFGSKSDYGDKVAERLLEGGLVLPILDGLDELPGAGGPYEDGRARVVREINDSKLKSRLVLTCQQQAYRDLDDLIEDAVVVKLAGVPTAEARNYIKVAALKHSHPERWLPVLDNLRDSPGGALGGSLTSPLMLFLLAEIYGRVGMLPSELLALPDSAAIDEHLLRGFVPAVYPVRANPKAGEPWRSDDARRWLGYLANALESDRPTSGEQRTTFGWWELSRFGRPLTSAVAGILGGLIGGVAVGSACLALFGLWPGLLLGAGAGLVLGYFSWKNDPPKPSETQTRTTGRAILKSGGLIGAIVFAGGLIARDPSLGIVAGLGFGLPIAALYGLTEPDPTLKPLDTRQLFLRDVGVGVKFGLTYGIPAAITAWWFLGAGPMLSTVVGISAGLAGGLLYGPVWVIAAIAQVKGATERVKSVGVVAFVHLGLATLYFAPRGKLPWRVITFLDGAHDLGVLRVISGSYQFRHRALQKVLAADYSGPTSAPSAARGNAAADPKQA